MNENIPNKERREGNKKKKHTEHFEIVYIEPQLLCMLHSCSVMSLE